MRTTWNLGLLYKGHDDPQIEKDMKAIERAYSAFEKKYRGKTDYLKGETKLFEALTDFEGLFEKIPLTKPLAYFRYVQDLDSNDAVARARANQLMERFAKNEHRIVFFELALAKIPPKDQKRFLASERLAHFRYFLKLVFLKGKHDLSEPEEKILGLKAIPAYEHWLALTDKLLGKGTVAFKGKTMPLSEASNKVGDLPLPERRELHALVMQAFEGLSDVATAELNAIVVNKKINDELRGYEKPYDETILRHQNDRKSALALVEAVTRSFPISHRFYALKARLLDLPNLEYSDRAVGIQKDAQEIPFDDAVSTVREVLGAADGKYLEIFEGFLKDGQIDVYPKIGKTGGAYCSGNPNAPTFVLLNYTESAEQVFTLAHEMGHAIHTELSKSQSALYNGYSISTAEVASTFFESLVFDRIFERATQEEKIALLHQKINDDVQTIFRQIACFNFEVELHETIRTKGGMSEAEIRALMNKHLSSYLGPAVRLKEIDGNHFVFWWHVRVFFYVYSYAFGQLISKSLYERYREDKGFIKKINQFLSAGGSDSPENIFKSIGVDVTKPDFWEKGLKSIERDIEELEKLTKNK